MLIPIDDVFYFINICLRRIWCLKSWPCSIPLPFLSKGYEVLPTRLFFVKRYSVSWVFSIDLYVSLMKLFVVTRPYFWAIINHALTHTYPHPPTPTHTQPIKSHTNPHPPYPAKKGHTHPHTPTPSKKRSHSPTPSNTQHKKHHIHPHPAKKWSHLPKSTHTKPKKVTLPHTHPQPDKKGHSQPKEGHAHSCITERKNVTCLTHT